jgi:hypothetical protein
VLRRAEKLPDGRERLASGYRLGRNGAARILLMRGYQKA